MPKSKYSDLSGEYLKGAESDFYKCPYCNAYANLNDFNGTQVLEKIEGDEANHVYDLANGFLLRVVSATDESLNPVTATIVSHLDSQVKITESLTGHYLWITYDYGYLCPFCNKVVVKGT